MATGTNYASIKFHGGQVKMHHMLYTELWLKKSNLHASTKSDVYYVINVLLLIFPTKILLFSIMLWGLFNKKEQAV